VTARALVLYAIALLPGRDVSGGEQDPSPTDGLDPAPLRPFLRKYCFGCHAEGARRGGLDLGRLSANVADPETHRRWVSVHDRVESGEMPPAKAPRPPSEDVVAFLRPLSRSLAQADRARRGAALRRLNRGEYENAVRHLFGIGVDLQDLLPRDTPAHGFDNVGEALGASSELIEAYLSAADLALDATFGPDREPERIRLRFPLSRDVEPHIGRLFRKTDDGVALMSGGNCPSAIRSFRPRLAGTYRVRIHARSLHADPPAAMAVHAGDVITHRGKWRRVGTFDLPHDRMTAVEFEERFLPGDSFQPTPCAMALQVREAPLPPRAGIVVGDVEVEGPLDPWPPPSRARLLGGVDPARGTVEDARAIFERLLPEAFRRPTAPGEAEPYVRLARRGLAQGRTFREALRLGLKAILCSPEFLFLEAPTAAGGDFGLAARLSFFLWRSVPDDALRHRAARAELRDPAVLRAETERMLRDPKAGTFTRDFVGQWLQLREIEATEPDRNLYPEFDELLKVSMVEETERFFSEVLEKDLSLDHFLDSDWTFLNERLARHYGIEGVRGQAFRKVTLPPGSVRGGVLTQASVLKVTANGTNTSPVTRGVWVLSTLLGKPPPPPPPGVPALEPDIRGATTLREQLARHRNVDACAVCHRKIDPPGFVLENFDVIGGWREWYRTSGEGERVDRYADAHANVRVRYRKGKPVDAAGQTAEGRAFSDVREFKKILLEDKDAFARCLAEKLLTVALGRAPGFSDRPAVEAIVAGARRRGYGLRSLIHEIVQSGLFGGR
jgi:mono/diheme cytochrome c family protein